MKTLGKLFIFFTSVLAAQGESQRLAALAAKAEENEFPHQVSIQINGKHHCGGALITKEHVLTAGHCVRDIILSSEPNAVKAQKVLVEIGSNIIGSGIGHSVKRISQHRNYSGLDENNPLFLPTDIGVITLKKPVTESESVKLIDLPAEMSEVPEGSEATISGFGNDEVGKPTSDVLQKSPMRIVSQEECNKHYTKSLLKTILPSHICANMTVGHGTCQGDSGGPLIQGNTVIGIVSGGDKYCGNGDPDVYTKVSHFIPYIRYELNYDSSTPEKSNSPALAINLDDSSSSQGPEQPRAITTSELNSNGPGNDQVEDPKVTVDSSDAQQYPAFSQNPGNVALVNPNAGASLTMGGAALIDPVPQLPDYSSAGFLFPEYSFSNQLNPYPSGSGNAQSTDPNESPENHSGIGFSISI